jgi:hypothetical protein
VSWCDPPVTDTVPSAGDEAAMVQAVALGKGMVTAARDT